MLSRIGNTASPLASGMKAKMWCPPSRLDDASNAIQAHPAMGGWISTPESPPSQSPTNASGSSAVAASPARADPATTITTAAPVAATHHASAASAPAPDPSDTSFLSSAPAKTETSTEKFLRKSKENPIVPIGSVLVLFSLMSGFRSLRQRDPLSFQHAMRRRVQYQTATIGALVAGWAFVEYRNYAQKSEKAPASPSS